MEVAGVPLRLPKFVTELRPHQLEAADQIVSQFQDRNVIFLDAPTGAGKTIIGESVRQVMESKNRANKSLYVCTTKSLQAQFLHDFPYARLIKGRANYPTYDQPGLFKMKGARRVDASHCTKRRFAREMIPLCDECHLSDPDISFGDEQREFVSHCHYCHPVQACPYDVAKNDALRPTGAPLVVANTAYYLTEANGVGRFGERINDITGTVTPSPFSFVIIDEADTLESVLMGHIELSFTPRVMKRYGLEPPELVTKPSSWLQWSSEAKEVIQDQLVTLANTLETYIEDPPPKDLQREYKQAVRDFGALNQVETALDLEPDNWVLDNYQEGGVTLKPVTVSSHCRELLWRHSKKFLLMSATVISPDQMALDLGLAEHEFGFVSVDSNFPPERRPVYVNPLANMTNKTKDTAWPRMVKAVDDILTRHVGERILVHTVSYALAQYLHDNLTPTAHGSRLLTYSGAQDRESALETYKTRPDAVMLAPSLDRGIDLPYELCSVIVIAKVPFPNLGDKQINKRFYGTGQAGKNWYVTETIRSIVQMTGRGMRHRDDYCTTYILDSQFKSNVWANSIGRSRIPRWWTDALKFPSPKRRT